MTLPDNIKEEIEKEAQALIGTYRVYAMGDFHPPLIRALTKFYELGKKDLVAALEELSLEQLKALKQRGEEK